MNLFVEKSSKIFQENEGMTKKSGFSEKKSLGLVKKTLLLMNTRKGLRFEVKLTVNIAFLSWMKYSLG